MSYPNISPILFLNFLWCHLQLQDDFHHVRKLAVRCQSWYLNTIGWRGSISFTMLSPVYRKSLANLPSYLIGPLLNSNWEPALGQACITGVKSVERRPSALSAGPASHGVWGLWGGGGRSYNRVLLGWQKGVEGLWPRKPLKPHAPSRLVSWREKRCVNFTCCPAEHSTIRIPF